MNKRIDSHQHFWRLDRGEYYWITEELAAINRNFQTDDLEPLLKAENISQTVVVQAAPTVAETEYLLALAEHTDFVAGVVGWVDMSADDAVDTLNKLSKNPWFKGIRPMIQEIPDPEWMLKTALDPAFQWLIDKDFCFDALVFPLHLQYLLELLQRYPDLRTVIDHGAKPDIAKQNFTQWAAGMTAIAEQTNSYCKLSGLLTEAAPGAGYEELLPYIQHLLHCFGPERLMWGSDWPVLNLANDYSNWLTMTEQCIANLSVQEKSLIMGGNAARFYKL